MSLAQRFERRLESLVGSAFARVFKGQVEPVEIGSALQREAGDKRNVMGSGQVLSPNRYRITLSPSDYDRLLPWEVQLTNSLAELVQEHLDENGWSTIGDIEVYLARDESLHTGVFGVASRMEPNAPPRQRPHDSLSMPAVPAGGPSDYAQPAGAPQQNQQAYPQSAPPEFGYGSPYAAAPQPVPSWAAPPQPAYPGHQEPQYRPAPPSYSPPPAPKSVLVVDGTSRRYELKVGKNLIGRGVEADFQVLDQGVSRRHLDIEFDGQQATAYDLGSTNGTSVNGHQVNSHVLQHGDVVRLGHTRLVYQQEHA